MISKALPAWGPRPVRASYSSTPTAYQSAPGVARWCSVCSGAT